MLYLVKWPKNVWLFGQISFGHLAKIRLVIWRVKDSAHFLPLHLNSERKTGKDLEMTGKCLRFFGIISCYYVKNGVYLQK